MYGETKQTNTNMKTYYAVKTAKGKWKLNELPGGHTYTIHSSTYAGAEKCLRMLQSAAKRLSDQDPSENE